MTTAAAMYSSSPAMMCLAQGIASSDMSHSDQTQFDDKDPPQVPYRQRHYQQQHHIQMQRKFSDTTVPTRSVGFSEVSNTSKIYNRSNSTNTYALDTSNRQRKILIKAR